MALHQEHANGLLLAWPTPILSRQVGTPELQTRLKEVILAREAQYPDGINRSLVNGWHSDTDLMSWPDTSIADFGKVVRYAVVDFLAMMNDGQKPAGKATITAWANITRRGGFHRMHTHHSSMISGVFYVDIGQPDPDDTEFNGTICFLDPRIAVEMIQIPGNPFGSKLKVEPKPGMMLLFPSWLQHFVDPFRGDGTRVSIAFNIALHSARQEDAQ